MSRIAKLLPAVESMQRDAEVFKAKDGKWYYFIAHREYGEYPDGDSYGPFSSEENAEKHMYGSHSNPGGHNIDDSGKAEVPKGVKRP